MDQQTEEKLRSGHINTLRAAARSAGVIAKGSQDEIIERMKAAEAPQTEQPKTLPVVEETAETPPEETTEQPEEQSEEPEESEESEVPPPPPEPEPGDCRDCIFYPENVITGDKAEERVFRTKHFTVRPCGIDPCRDQKFEAR